MNSRIPFIKDAVGNCNKTIDTNRKILMHTKLALTLTLPNLLGLVGVIITLLAYGLLQTGKLDATTKSYSILNIVGSMLIVYSLCFDWNLSAFVMESAWCAFSIYGLCRLLKHRST